MELKTLLLALGPCFYVLKTILTQDEFELLARLRVFGVKSVRRLKELGDVVQKVGVVDAFSLTLTLVRQRLTERRLGRLYLNPFTGFVLSNWFFSSEVEELRMRHLNFSSRKLREFSASKVREGSIIFVQVDELNDFIENILPEIRTRFVLITGKFHLPGLELSSSIRQLGQDPRVALWFSQHQVYEDLKAIPFPYGLNFFTLRELHEAVSNLRDEIKLDSIFIPFSRVHPHLKGDALRIRTELTPFMSPLSGLEEYYRQIMKHRFVVSPPGDRPDTFRHYECIALGSHPISSLPQSFRRIFGDNMIYSDNLVEAARGNFNRAKGSPNPEFVHTRFWRKLVQKLISHS